MKSILLGVVLIFVLLSTGKDPKAGEAWGNDKAESPVKASANQQGSAAPVGFFPDGPRYVLRENEAYVVVVSADCPSGSTTDATFELQSPTPDFVRVFPNCKKDGQAQALLAFTPKAGDSGKHFVKIKVLPCGGPGGVFILELKVKKASPARN